MSTAQATALTAAEILNQSFLEIRRALDSGLVTSHALTQESLRRANNSQGDLNSFITICDDSALTEAAAADVRLQAGERSALLGIPVAVKDLILAKGSITSAASRMLAEFKAPYDATVVQKLRAAGAPIVGKTNLDEFAMGSSNETSHFGPVKNPWNLSKVPGGSSGGSAAAVAARICPVALGTDTGGSIRQPASFCGITGIKPTYGRVSRFGVVAFASSLDQVGPMGVDAIATAAMLETIAGFDGHDATSSEQSVPKYFDKTVAAYERKNLQGLRVGIPSQYFEVAGLSSNVSAHVRHAIDSLVSMGAVIVPIELTTLRYALPTYYIVCTSECSSNLARYSGVHFGHRSHSYKEGDLESLNSMSRSEGFGDEVRLRIILGTFALSSGYYDAFYKKASQVRRLIKQDFENAFTKCDVIAGPTAPTTAFSLNEKYGDPRAMYASDIYTLSANLAGVPALSVNIGLGPDYLPMGMQLTAPWWREEVLLETAACFQARNAHLASELPAVAQRFVGMSA